MLALPSSRMPRRPPSRRRPRVSRTDHGDGSHVRPGVHISGTSSYPAGQALTIYCIDRRDHSSWSAAVTTVAGVASRRRRSLVLPYGTCRLARDPAGTDFATADVSGYTAAADHRHQQRYSPDGTARVIDAASCRHPARATSTRTRWQVAVSATWRCSIRDATRSHFLFYGKRRCIGARAHQGSSGRRADTSVRRHNALLPEGTYSSVRCRAAPTLDVARSGSIVSTPTSRGALPPPRS